MGDADPSRSRADALARRRGAPRPLAPPDLTVEGAALPPRANTPAADASPPPPAASPSPRPRSPRTRPTPTARVGIVVILPNADADASRGPAAASPSESRKRRASPGAPGNAPDADPRRHPRRPPRACLRRLRAPPPPPPPGSPPPPSVLPADVPHVRQEHNWDCGLACALSALRCMGADRTVTLATLRRLCPTRSVWTVDASRICSGYSASPSGSAR